VAGGGDDVHLEITDGEDVSCGEPFGAEAEGRVEGAYAAAVALGEGASRFGVVRVVVRQQYADDLMAHIGDGIEVRLDRRTGSTTRDRAPDDSTQVLVPSRVMMSALGASTQVADAPNVPPTQLMRGSRGVGQGAKRRTRRSWGDVHRESSRAS
jgi:hypothetical protein